jgi:hypothetical protein
MHLSADELFNLNDNFNNTEYINLISDEWKELLHHYKMGHTTKLKNAICEWCLRMKGNAKGHSTSNPHKPEEFNDTLNVDLSGPVSTVSIRGHKYLHT